MIGNGKREMGNGVGGDGQAFRVQTLVCLFSRVETLKRDCEVRGLSFRVFYCGNRQAKA
jgi:hypothetical protein